VVLAAVDDAGEAVNPITIPWSDSATIVDTARALGTFRAVIEACGTYRWLYAPLRPHGTVPDKTRSAVEVSVRPRDVTSCAT
jgi:hypothetical protein